MKLYSVYTESSNFWATYSIKNFISLYKLNNE